MVSSQQFFAAEVSKWAMTWLAWKLLKIVNAPSMRLSDDSCQALTGRSSFDCFLALN